MRNHFYSRNLYVFSAAFSLLVIVIAGCAFSPENWGFRNEVIQADRLSELNRIALLDIQPSGELAETIQKELKGNLEQAGKEVILVKAERKDNSRMLDSFDQFQQIDADAILEVVPFGFGYEEEAQLIKSRRRVSPFCNLAYRLVSAKNSEILIQSNIYYSSFDYSEHISTVGNKIRGPSWHIYENEKALKNNPEEAKERLIHAIEESVKLISVMVTD